MKSYGSLYTYLRPYRDDAGILHDPRTEWDELLKYCKPWVLFLQIGEASRRMCKPASVSVQADIREGERRHRENRARVDELEAADLERANRSKSCRSGRKKGTMC